MKDGGCVVGSAKIGRKEDSRTFLNRYPWIRQLMMSSFKAKTGKYLRVNSWGIINWIPILHTKASLRLPHPPPYHQSLLLVFTSSLSLQYRSADSGRARLSGYFALENVRCQICNHHVHLDSSSKERKGRVQALCTSSQHSQNLCLSLQQPQQLRR